MDCFRWSSYWYVVIHIQIVPYFMSLVVHSTACNRYFDIPDPMRLSSVGPNLWSQTCRTAFSTSDVDTKGNKRKLINTAHYVWEHQWSLVKDTDNPCSVMRRQNNSQLCRFLMRCQYRLTRNVICDCTISWFAVADLFYYSLFPVVCGM